MQVDRFVSELAKDTTSALRAKKGLIRQKYKGTGKFSGATRRNFEATLAAQMPTPPTENGKGWILNSEQIAIATDVVRQLAGSAPPSTSETAAPEEALNFRVAPEAVAALLDIPIAGPAQMEAIVKQLAWEPDFFVVNEAEGFRVPKAFLPESMKPRPLMLARFWAEMCRFVLMQLGCGSPYGVGWVFEHNVGARSMHEDGENWLLLNPYPDAVGGRVFHLTDRDDVAYLYALAVHECTHLANDISWHDEAFASAFTRNVAKTAGKTAQISGILKALRAEGAEAREARGRERRERLARDARSRALVDETYREQGFRLDREGRWRHPSDSSDD